MEYKNWKNYLPNYIGGVLVIMYVLQVFVPGMHWGELASLQENQSFKRWSGLLLAMYMAFQWTLSYVRVRQKHAEIAEDYTNVHLYVGALSPALLYVHTMELGYLYTAWFAYAFLTNILLGLFNTETFRDTPYWYYISWTILHVGLSLFLTFMLFYHIFNVFYFK